jgi:integrator complex subunit 2
VLQGYPLELLGVTVAGVPSMHICLDFAPELLAQPSLEKQVWYVLFLIIEVRFDVCV